jgi:glycosyltransferase involved in cell wall biosynthesis
MKLRIGILGTRGVPNNYGGFECFAEHLSQGLVEKGHEVIVYNSHNHPNRQSYWNGVQIVHCWDPEYMLGSFGQFIYDFNCIMDARKRKLDVLLFLGYTSSSVWAWLNPRKPVIIYNMDGLEWKRTKYSKNTQRFLQYAEKLAIQCSDFIVADSQYIQSYLSEKYAVSPEYIAYGADVFQQPNETVLGQYHLQKQSYNMLMARMEPENNIEMILDGYLSSISPLEFIVVGNTDNTFGTYLVNKFSHDKRIRFMGAIFNQQHINNLIYFSNLYFHGHSVGGTNPSLLEAMGSHALIIAQDNIFNRTVLTENAFYFTTAVEVTTYADTLLKDPGKQPIISANGATICKQYSWKKVIDEYETFFMSCYRQKAAVVDSEVIKQPC